MKTTAWVKRAAAKVGASFILDEYGKRFTVEKVYRQNTFEASELAAKQAKLPPAKRAKVLAQ